MKHSPFVRSKAAFTLVELLVVIGIIAILGSISFAGYNQAIRAAHGSKCLSNMRQLAGAALLYAGDNNGSFPTADAPVPWDTAITPYIGGTANKANEILKCPSDTRPLIVDASGVNFARSYTISGVSDVYGVSGGTNIGADSRSVQQINTSTQVILFAEWFAPQNYQYNGGYAYIKDGVDVSTFTNGQLSHGSKMNFAFTDGHAEALTPLAAQPYWQAVR